MAALSGIGFNRQNEVTGITIIAACLLLPALFPLVFGWAGALSPTPAFYFIQRLGPAIGYRLLRISVLCAVAIGAIFNVLHLVLFSLTFLAIPIALHRATIDKQSPISAAMQALTAMVVTWAAFWGIFFITSGDNPYSLLLATIAQSLEKTLMLYREGSHIAPDMLVTLEASIKELQTLLPKIVPGCLLAGLVFTVWVNQAWSNMLLAMPLPEANNPWPAFRTWQLPDYLVWPLIISGILFLVPLPGLKTFGLNMLIVTSSVFALQGVAILLFFLHKSNIPRLLRLMIYGLLIMQSYGILFVTLFGIIDVWANIRKLGTDPPLSPDDPDTPSAGTPNT